jgi:FkbM family methyltransferase
MNLHIFRERAFAKIRRYLLRGLRPPLATLRTVKYNSSEFLVWAHEDVGWRLLSERSYEPVEIASLARLVKPEDICVDVGANIGLFTVFLSRWASAGHVHAFEPLEHNASVLRLNLELNNRSNVTVHTEILSDTDGLITFSIAEDAAYSSMVHTGRKALRDTVEVTSRTLDAFRATLGTQINVIKIDVEGAELLVLKGGDAMLQDPAVRPRAIMAEVYEPNSRNYGYSPSDLVEYLRGRGYHANALMPDGSLGTWPREGALLDILFTDPSQEFP